MCGAIAEAVLNRQHHLASESETEPRGFAYHISKICAILNKKLDGSEGGGVDAITLHCIAMLAWMGVRSSTVSFLSFVNEANMETNSVMWEG